jgi:hypothetical protein
MRHRNSVTVIPVIPRNSVIPVIPVIPNAPAFALRFDGRKRKHDAGEFKAAIVAKRLVAHLEQAGFVVMKKPPSDGDASALGRGSPKRDG